jgi:hypothetical protein
VREEYRVYFDRNATPSASERRVQAGCIAARTPRDFFHRLLSPSGPGEPEASTGSAGRREPSCPGGVIGGGR